MYAEVVIPLALPKNYTWHVPDSMRSQIKMGCRVEVNLRNRKYAGIVLDLHENDPNAFKPKDILSILDSEPVVYPLQLQLWKWMADYYLCTQGEVMAAALPAHLKLSSETVLVYNQEYGDDFSALNHDEYLIAEALLIKKELQLSVVQQMLPNHSAYQVVKRLLEIKICNAWESLRETYKERKETFVLLDSAFKEESRLAELLNDGAAFRRSEKQLELLLAYLHLAKAMGAVTKSELLKKSGASESQLKGLVAKAILKLEKRAVDRIPHLAKQISIDFQLTSLQQATLDRINQIFQEKRVCLLHGVTSSGKTQIYIRLIEKFLQIEKQVLYLVPEIALTAQIIKRLQTHFGGYIGIYHSKFSQNERFEIWKKLKNREISIVLGARSAIFLPFTDLGLVIIDEEHDASYKQQDPAPRYQARDTAIFYAGLFQSQVLLGSATPSLESYFNGAQHKYGLAYLGERYGQLPLPSIELIDTRKLMGKGKNKVIFSPSLISQIQVSLDNNKQVILFQNRRGYSPYQICKICGWIPQCQHCDVSLTYHKLSHLLICHYCGSTYQPFATCPACGGHDFLQRNFGTERIEEQLQDIFPKARVGRMDVDTVRGKNAHKDLLELFEQKRIDILVGTQMVVKGLDFQCVDLVGIPDADALLNFTDFRVTERAFQLMEQVSGRAGRKEAGAKVLIQVANTGHPVLSFVMKHDYVSFYLREIEERRQFFYPPFSRVIQVTFKHKEKERVDQAAAVFSQALKKEFKDNVIGPAEPVISRIRDLFLMELLLKLPRDGVRIQLAKTMIHQQSVILLSNKKFRSVAIVPDVDPL